MNKLGESLNPEICKKQEDKFIVMWANSFGILRAAGFNMAALYFGVGGRAITFKNEYRNRK